MSAKPTIDTKREFFKKAFLQKINLKAGLRS